MDKRRTPSGTAATNHRRRMKEASALPDGETMNRLTEFFRVFGDETRLRILHLLSREELCVHDIAGRTGMQQSAISHQLRVLKQARLVRYRREGKTMLYTLNDSHVQQVFDQGLEHVME